MTDEQNDIDLRRMHGKRARAFTLLDEFKDWYMVDDSNIGNMLIITGLQRDILRGTEDEVDRLTERLEEKNQAALMKKLETE